jgi:hypothetical protein
MRWVRPCGGGVCFVHAVRGRAAGSTRSGSKRGLVSCALTAQLRCTTCHSGAAPTPACARTALWRRQLQRARQSASSQPSPPGPARPQRRARTPILRVSPPPKSGCSALAASPLWMRVRMAADCGCFGQSVVLLTSRFHLEALREARAGWVEGKGAGGAAPLRAPEVQRIPPAHVRMWLGCAPIVRREVGAAAGSRILLRVPLHSAHPAAQGLRPRLRSAGGGRRKQHKERDEEGRANCWQPPRHMRSSTFLKLYKVPS